MITSPTVERRLQHPSGETGSSSDALDQWRGLALVLVLISHGFFFTNRVHGIGRVGVNLFFFISGLLVFRSLSRRTSSEPLKLLKSFWVKRFARLYPALLAYVCAMLPVTILLQSVPGKLEHLDLTSYLHTVPFALGYLINYWPTAGSPALQHLWSLSCEMQFYLLAPILFILGGHSRFRQLAIWGGVLLALIISGLAFPLLKGVGAGKYHFEQAVWPMMLGFFCEYQKDLLKKINPTLMFLGVCGAIVLFLASMVFMLFGIEMKKLVIASGAGIFLPCFWAYSTNRPIPGILGRTLTWLGKRTYSIYLWQQPLTICNYLPFALQPLGSLVSILIGGISFQIFERRFLSRGKK